MLRANDEKSWAKKYITTWHNMTSYSESKKKTLEEVYYMNYIMFESEMMTNALPMSLYQSERTGIWSETAESFNKRIDATREKALVHDRGGSSGPGESYKTPYERVLKSDIFSRINREKFGEDFGDHLQEKYGGAVIIKKAKPDNKEQPE